MQYEHYVIEGKQPPYTAHIPTMGSNRTADVQSSEVGKTLVPINRGSRY